MAFLDFLKNRNSEQPTAVNAKAQEQSQPNKRVEDLPAHVKAQAVEAAHPAAKLMDSATQHQSHRMEGQSGHGDSREALMHNQSAHGKAQEAMSPTDSHKGHTQSQARTMERSRGMER
jgi:hypothetical protein